MTATSPVNPYARSLPSDQNNVANNITVAERNNVNNNGNNAIAVAEANPIENVLAKRAALIRIWDAMFRGARRYVERNGFIGVHNLPEIVGVTGACENVDTLFKVDFFGEKAYLAQSDQLYLELITPFLGKVYAEIQSFRMEPDADDRHLCQFALFEIEHLGDLNELIANIGGIVKSAVNEVVNDCVNDLAAYGRNPLDLVNLEFGRITYSEAIKILADDYPDLSWGDDLTSVHEARLTEILGPVFVTHYPLPIKFFNMMQNSDDPRVVNSTDLLLPFSGESAGAAEREVEHDRIENRLKSSEMYRRLISLGSTDEDFAWYLDAHKGREVPLHSGAGIGMARVAQFILGVDDIREAVPYLINRENLL